MRQISSIILHCSATRADRRYTFLQCRFDHVNNNHWSDIGYHYYIERDGSIHEGRPLEQVGAHCLGHNNHSIGICYEGGLVFDGTTVKPSDTRTPQQHQSLLRLLRSLKIAYPQATIHGHNEFSSKPCPCFDVQSEYGSL